MLKTLNNIFLFLGFLLSIIIVWLWNYWSFEYKYILSLKTFLWNFWFELLSIFLFWIIFFIVKNLFSKDLKLLNFLKNIICFFLVLFILVQIKKNVLIYFDTKELFNFYNIFRDILFFWLTIFLLNIFLPFSLKKSEWKERWFKIKFSSAFGIFLLFLLWFFWVWVDFLLLWQRLDIFFYVFLSLFYIIFIFFYFKKNNKFKNYFK